MKVSAYEPFRLVYALFEHQYLGYLIEAFVVQLNPRGELTFLNQRLSSQNVMDFAAGLTDTDLELVPLIDDIQQEAILRKFNQKKLPAVDFFLKVYDAQKGDKSLQDEIGRYLERGKCRIVSRMSAATPFFMMGNDGDPTWMPITWMPQPAKLHFHFIRNQESTHYFPIIRYPTGALNSNGKPETVRIDFQHGKGLMICDNPAHMLVGNQLYTFGKYVDGKKLRPFLQKQHIVIPRALEPQYYDRFVTPLIAAYDVYAQGFEIRHEKRQSVEPYLIFNESDCPDKDPDGSPCVTFALFFTYNDYYFQYTGATDRSYVQMEHQNDAYTFYKIRRDATAEQQTLLKLKHLGLPLEHGQRTLSRAKAFEWLNSHQAALKEAGIQVQQHCEDTRRYFLGYARFDVSVSEGRDWFDVRATVRFGEFEIPFLKLRSLILAHKREFTLPNGELAVIPETWFTRYSELLGLLKQHDGHDDWILPKLHVGLVSELDRQQLATVTISRELERLRDFEEIQTFPLPAGFKSTLRPYQKAGYDWLNFLRHYHFGGCLADDMGLGKTVMTLALLQASKEEQPNRPSLLVMPTSLLYNWELEARRFTPGLRVMLYKGTYREKNTALFDDYDLVLTSYGIVRLDIELLQTYRFHYVILDESQAIKNPSSHVTKAVMHLQANHRLILTGTPLENSTMDVWSQMSFINPGLLGTQSFFRNEFQLPIEKGNDEAKLAKLNSLIKPFMLRRSKQQVAGDLPEKVEAIQYCDMTPDQAEHYEKAKSYYRNMILEHIEEEGMARSQMIVLQGLTKLRQLANHPRLIDADYTGESGKLDDVLLKLESALSENHKVLIFSQFVKHLTVFRQYLNRQKISYTYLDGSSTDRAEQIHRFQTDESVKIFLISLKAGGVGHNLTAADYVFILDPWWNPAIEAQAVDRAHRIGQTQTVFTYKFIAKNTVEEKILALQQTKQQLAGSLITAEENFVKSLSKDDILALLE